MILFYSKVCKVTICYKRQAKLECRGRVVQLLRMLNIELHLHDIFIVEQFT